MAAFAVALGGVTSSAAAGAAAHSPAHRPASVAKATAAAVVTPPPDDDPSIPGTQVKVPYYSEPEFLLTDGHKRWNVRNRPAGTIAAGYGHPTGADHNALLATARYADATAPTAVYAAPGVTTAPPGWDSDPLDISYYAADDPSRTADLAHLDRSYYLTRYQSGLLEVSGPVEGGLNSRLAFASPDAGVTYVGGAVESDDATTNTLRVLLVRSDGKIVRATVTGGGASFAQVADLGQPALAAVARTVSHFAKMPRGTADGTDTMDPFLGFSASSTILLVMRADGQFAPFAFSSLTDLTTLPLLSSQDASLKVTPPVGVIPGQVLLDFDWGCQWVTAPLTSGVSATGLVASYLNCEPGHRDAVAGDQAAVGRISVAVEMSGDFVVHALTAGDNVTEVAANQHQILRETDNSSACNPGGSIRPGSFDIRVLAGVTYLGCVQQGDAFNGMKMTTYTFPTSLTVFKKLAWPARASGVTIQNLGRLYRSNFDGMAQPAPGQSWTGEKASDYVYDRFSEPVMQLQFPCAELLARPTRTGTALGDCDPSTGVAPGATNPSGATEVSPPSNWVSYTIADYASKGPGNYELVVTNTPADLAPADRTINAAGNPPAFGPKGYTRDNFTATVPVSPYLATDLGALNSGANVDVTTFNKYVSGTNTLQQPLFLAQVPRPSRTTLEVTLNKTTPDLDTTPSVPVAVLQAPPTVAGLGQQNAFTPEFGTSTGGGTGATSGTTSSLGGHIGGSVVITGGFGIAGNDVRAGGGVGFDVEWNKEAEQSITKSVEITRDEGYGGSFADTTVVTRAFKEYVWPGTVIKDPTGLSEGQEFDYRLPAEELVQSLPLSTLADKAPGFYGPDGVFTDSLARITNNGALGNPGQYYQGADSATPSSILESNGGPCIGGYAASNAPTDLAALPVPADPDNPYLAKPIDVPQGPNVILSAQHQVSVGNDLTESAKISVDQSTNLSKVATKSLDWSVTAIGKFEAETQLGASAKVEVEIDAGINGAYASSNGVEDSVSTGSSISNVMGNIPFKAADVGSWINSEQYNWRMYFCKARLGPAGFAQTVWVQGYVTSGYNGTGGLTDLSDATAVSPVNAAFVPGVKSGDLVDGTATPCPSTPETGQQQFSWSHPAGTIKNYRLELFDSTIGKAATYQVASWSDPDAFNSTVKRDPEDNRAGVADRISCAQVPTSQLVAGHLYRWQLVATAFTNQEVSSPPAYFRPTVDVNPTPVVSLVVRDAKTVTEGDPSRFAVRLDKPVASPVYVTLTTVSKTARAGKDFKAKTATIKIPIGKLSATFSVATLRDRLRETQEYFRVKVTKVSRGIKLKDGVGTGTIRDRR